MSLHDCFSNLFQKSDGLDPEDILAEIRDNRSTLFFIDTLNFDKRVLFDFIAEENCCVIFHIDDGFDFDFRNHFIIDLPVSSITENVYIIEDGFEIEELNNYAVHGATIYVCMRGDMPMFKFSLVPFSNKIPGRVKFTPKGYSKKEIIFILKKAKNIRLVFRKQDFSTTRDIDKEDVEAFIETGNDRINIEKEGFTDAEVNSFISKGARLY